MYMYVHGRENISLSSCLYHKCTGLCSDISGIYHRVIVVASILTNKGCSEFITTPSKETLCIVLKSTWKGDPSYIHTRFATVHTQYFNHCPMTSKVVGAQYSVCIPHQETTVKPTWIIQLQLVYTAHYIHTT